MKTNKKHRKKDMTFIREKEAIQVNSLKTKQIENNYRIHNKGISTPSRHSCLVS